MIRMGCLTILAAMMVAMMAWAGSAEARQVYVPGHYLANGRYVAPFYRQVPDTPVYPGYGAVDPEGNVVPYANGVPVPVPYGAPYGGAYGAPYGAAPYVPAPGYVPGYGYGPR